MVLGNYALHLQQSGAVPVVDLVMNEGQAAAIAAVIRSLPAGQFVLAIFVVITIVFAATTYDSASYTLASIATRRLPAEDHPPGWQRVFWAFMLGILPAALLYLGGLKSLQTISIIVSLPLIPVFVLIAVALVKSLRRVPPGSAPQPIGGVCGSPARAARHPRPDRPRDPSSP